MKKRRPHYPLADIKAALGDPKTLNRTVTAAKGAAALGFDSVTVAAVVEALTARDFHKSMTAHASSRIWQDVYKPVTAGGSLYVKFTIDHEGKYLLISFKEA